MDTERFELNSGRQRPEYQPKNIHCPGCGAGLTIKDERSEMVVCEYCDSQLEVTATEQKVLGKLSPQDISFPLKVGDSYYHKGTRFEILARLAYIEEGDWSEMTREYLLYNPRRGTLWLGEYQENYSLSESCHVTPVRDVFGSSRGSLIKTHDGGEWVVEELGEYELVHVDGALPWIARVGDRIQYAELSEKSGSGRQYEVQKINQEIEYGMGRRLPLAAVRSATRKPELGKAAVRELPDSANRRKWYKRLMYFALLGILINGVAAVYCGFSGKVVLKQRLSAKGLNDGIYTKAFPIRGGDTVTEVTTWAPLDNAWMEVQEAIVREDHRMMHNQQTGLEYYHGYEGGESWSEGSKKKSYLVRIPKPGNYRIFVQAVSARGNASDARRALHDVNIAVCDGALPWGGLVFMCVVCAILLMFTLISYGKWRGGITSD